MFHRPFITMRYDCTICLDHGASQVKQLVVLLMGLRWCSCYAERMQ